MKLTAFLSFLFLPFIFSCTQQNDQWVELEQDMPLRSQLISTSSEIIRPFQTALQSALMQAMSESAEHAVEVCRDRAPEIAKMTLQNQSQVEIQGQKFAVDFGRSSHLLRNPENKAQSFMDDYLEKMQGKKIAQPAEYIEVLAQRSSGSYVAMFPIPTAQACMTCHGPQVSDHLLSVIEESYPHDRARGFEQGEFRGLFWVKFRPVL